MSYYRKLMRKEAFDPSCFGVVLNVGYFTRRGLRNAIRRHADRMSGSMVDFGCGSRPYEHFFKVDKYIGVDIDDGRQVGRVDVFYDGQTIPLPDGSVDCILASEVFEHVFNLSHILSELNRILRPGGIMLVTCPFAWPEHEVPYDFARYTRFAMASQFSQAGYQVLVEEKEGHFIEAVTQLALVYATKYFRPQWPVVGRLIEFGWNALFNTGGVLLGAVLPRRWDYYLTNIFVVQKHSNPRPLGGGSSVTTAD